MVSTKQKTIALAMLGVALLGSLSFSAAVAGRRLVQQLCFLGRVCREKQIGHSYLMDRGGVPITSPEEFARRFGQEILPLLQEYCYDDYSKLAEFIGPDIVDVEAQAVDSEVISDPARLIEALNKLIAD